MQMEALHYGKLQCYCVSGLVIGEMHVRPDGFWFRSLLGCEFKVMLNQ